MPTQTLAIFLLGTVGAGGLLWVLVYPLLSGERAAEKRRDVVARPAAMQRHHLVRAGAKTRREQVEETLKQVEQRRKNTNRPPLAVRLTQAGLSWSTRQFVLISIATGLAMVGLGFVLGFGPVPSVLLGFAGGFGAPRWLLGFMKKRREKRFLNVFPDARRCDCTRHQGWPAAR